MQTIINKYIMIETLTLAGEVENTEKKQIYICEIIFPVLIDFDYLQIENLSL